VLVEFRILGPLELLDEGEPVPLGRLKERIVLAVLLLHANEVVSRERLIDELWGESPPPTARKAVNVHLSQLRKTLARNGDDPIATTAGGYRLALEPDQLDSARVQRLLAAARERVAAGELEAAGELLSGALALWRGPTLAGLQLESLGRDEVEQLDELRLTALMDRIDCKLALGRHEDVLGELHLLVREHPLRERLRAQLMLALYRADRQAEALEAYQQTRQILVEQLGIEPSVALQRLQQGILCHDPALERSTGISDANGLGTTGPFRQQSTALDPLPSAPRRLRGRRRHLGAAAPAAPGPRAEPAPRPNAKALAVAVAIIVVAGASAGAIVLTRGNARASRLVAVAANSVAKIDASSGRVLADLPVGDTPVALVASKKSLWVVNRGDRTVSRIDTRTGRVRALGGSTFAYDIAAAADGNVWISDSHRSSVVRMNSGTEGFPSGSAAPETVQVPGRAGPVAAGGGYLWVGEAAFQSLLSSDPTGVSAVARIDLRTHRLTSVVRLPQVPIAIIVAYGSTWVVNWNNSLSVIRPGSTRPQTISLPLQPNDAALAIASGLGSVWIVSRNGSVLRVDPDSLRVVARVRPRSPEATPNSFGIAVAGGYVWMTNRASSTVSQIDPSTNRIVRTLAVGRFGIVPCGIIGFAGALWVTIAPDSNCGQLATL
jgi:DNA-binding SARP family transcriptional activator/DNA-binding beta-propeller fold protein YncE